MNRLFTVLVVLILWCVPATADDVEAAIRKSVETFEAGVRARNVDQVMSIYGDDALFMPPNLPAMKGSDAIRKFWSGMLAAPKADLDIQIDDIERCGDIIIERGRYELNAPAKDSGKYVVIWRNRGGTWRIETDIFNSSLPAAGNG